RPCYPLPRRDHAREARHPAPGRCGLHRPDPPPRALRFDLAGLRRDPARQDRGRDGRRAHLRLCLRAPRGDERRRHDRRLLPVHPRLPLRDRDADHQRGAGRQPRFLRRHLEAARHDRDGETGTLAPRPPDCVLEAVVIFRFQTGKDSLTFLTRGKLAIIPSFREWWHWPGTAPRTSLQFAGERGARETGCWACRAYIPPGRPGSRDAPCPHPQQVRRALWAVRFPVGRRAAFFIGPPAPSRALIRVSRATRDSDSVGLFQEWWPWPGTAPRTNPRFAGERGARETGCRTGRMHSPAGRCGKGRALSPSPDRRGRVSWRCVSLRDNAPPFHPDPHSKKGRGAAPPCQTVPRSLSGSGAERLRNLGREVLLLLLDALA